MEIFELECLNGSGCQYVIKGHVSDEAFRAAFLEKARDDWGLSPGEACEQLDCMVVTRGWMVEKPDKSGDYEFVWLPARWDDQGAFPATYSDVQ